MDRDAKAQLAAHHNQHRAELSAAKERAKDAVEKERVAEEKAVKLVQELEACKLLLDVERGARQRSHEALMQARYTSKDEHRVSALQNKSDKVRSQPHHVSEYLELFVRS